MTEALPARLEKDGDIGVIIVNYPPVNALGPGVSEGIIECLHQANADPAIKAMVLMGDGRSFIAGADIRGFGTSRKRPPLGSRTYDVLDASPKPVVAAIHGYALGGGLENAMACHYRIAVPAAKVGLPEVLIGILPGGGGTQRLPRLIGKGRALHLILSGEMIGAQEAYRIGLVNEIVPVADLITRAEAILKRIAANAPIAVKFALEAANKGMETSQGEGLLLEASYFGLCAATEDKKEGTTAFLEKRAPQFHGR
jgi:enoyl-CoA hydratase/carnithine racemase